MVDETQCGLPERSKVKTIGTQYCSDHHITIGGYYCDDGWSGTNFDCPDFKHMIDDIETGKINTVIVKGLPRFGREYAQMGLYIEHYFEKKGIRFISVAENIDTKIRVIPITTRANTGENLSTGMPLHKP